MDTFTFIFGLIVTAIAVGPYIYLSMVDNDKPE